MDPSPDTSAKPGLSWLWWALALPLVVTVVGGLAVEYMKPDKAPANSGPEGGQGAKANGERTYQYWCEANRVQERQIRFYATRGKGTREEVVGLLTATAAAVEGLPSQGVDADAIS